MGDPFDGVIEDVTLKNLSRSLQCKLCGIRTEKLSKCSRCKRTWYCGGECQVADWRNHKEICRQRTQAVDNLCTAVAAAVAGVPTPIRSSRTSLPPFKSDREEDAHVQDV